MLITCVLHIRPEGHREPRRKVGCLSLAERLGGFESGTFRFWSQRINPLGHSPQMLSTGFLEYDRIDILERIDIS